TGADPRGTCTRAGVRPAATPANVTDAPAGDESSTTSTSAGAGLAASGAATAAAGGGSGAGASCLSGAARAAGQGPVPAARLHPSLAPAPLRTAPLASPA